MVCLYEVEKEKRSIEGNNNKILWTVYYEELN